MKDSILVVDDEKGQAEILKAILEEDGYEVGVAHSGAEAMEALKGRPFSLVLTDLKMPGMTGLELMERIAHVSGAVPVVLMTAHGSIDSAVEALKKGAYDYLTKPIDTERLFITLRHALERSRLISENVNLKSELEGRFSVKNLIGSHGSMKEICRMIMKVAPSNSTVLILGESGTGKELVARAIHFNSARKGKRFMAINCAAIPDGLLESELFGHEKGAFTGAVSRKAGLLEEADGGTVFLDEIGEMGLPMQAKILRFLQEKVIRRVGGREEIKVDTRVIAATNRDLMEGIRNKTFREDLYYRLNVISLSLPPLRERKTDIPELVEFFISKANSREGKKVRRIEPDALNALMQFAWPGNVRQLESVIERAVILCDGDSIGKEDLPVEVHCKIDRKGALNLEIPDEGIDIEELEKGLIISALGKAGGNLAKAAPLLGMTYKTLQYRIEKFGIRKEDFAHQL